MAAIVRQLWGQNFQNGTAKQLWLFSGRGEDGSYSFPGTEDVDGRIKQFNDNEVPLVWAGLPIDTGWTINEFGGGTYTAEVNFSARAGNILDPTADETADHPQQGGDAGADQEVANNVSFSVRTGTLKITQSLETVSSNATGAGSTPRNFGGAIGVKDDGTVEGFEVYAGEPTWTLVGKIPAFLVTGAYQKRFQALFMPRPRMNADPFFGYARGELLILDGEISELASNGFRDVRVTFGVKLTQDLVTLSTDPLLELYDVGGWNVVWCTYKEQPQTLGGVTRRAVLPFEAYQERVYEYGDFTDLKIIKFKKKTVSP